jgi:hypothetical protein
MVETKVEFKPLRTIFIDKKSPNSILKIGKVNVPNEEKSDKFKKEKRIAVFDIESNGKEVLFGFYDGNAYRYKLIKKVEDVEEVLSWLISVEISYFYGDYDLPVSLSPFLTIVNISNYRKKNMADNAYRVGKYTVKRMKNLYSIETTERRSKAVNLLTFFSGSLFNSYMSFREVIKKTFRSEAFDDDTIKEWKEDKGKRLDFEKVKLDDHEIIKYNRLDCIATFQLVVIRDIIFPMKVELTLPASAVSYIVDQVDSDFIYYYYNGMKKLGIPNSDQTIDVMKMLYKGGLFDSNRLGIFDHVYKYDINSMYPYMMSNLPELEVIRVTDNPKSFTIDTPMLDGTWFNEDAKYLRIYSLCYKDNPKFIASKENGKLLRVKKSCTSVFDFEIMQNDKMIIKDFEMRGMIEFRIKRRNIFKNVIDQIYSKRLELKKQKNPFEKVYKLIMNSSYGKFGERIMTSDSRFKNTTYASMITALGRTYIQSAEIDSIGYLTDSLFITKPLKSYLVGDKLGQFKEEGEGKLYVIGNGLYVLDDPSEKMVKYRGFRFEKEEDAEKVIKYIAENLVQGKLVRVEVSTPIMIRNIYTMRVMEGDEVKIGVLANEEKILSPLNPKQRYVYEGSIWNGQMFRDKEDAKIYEKELKRKLEEIKPIPFKEIIDK